MIHQQIIKYSIKNNVFSIFMRCQNVNECVSWFWKFGSLALEMFWKKLGNMFRVVFTNPVTFTSSLKYQEDVASCLFFGSLPSCFATWKFPPLTCLYVCFHACLYGLCSSALINVSVCACMCVCIFVCVYLWAYLYLFLLSILNACILNLR